MSAFNMRRQRLDDRERDARKALEALHNEPAFLRAVEMGEPVPKNLAQRIAEQEGILQRVPIARRAVEDNEAALAKKRAAEAESRAVARLEELGGEVARCAREFMATFAELGEKWRTLGAADDMFRAHVRESDFPRADWFRLESGKLREQVLLCIGYTLRFDWHLLEGRTASLGDITYQDPPPTLDLADAWQDYLTDKTLRIEIDPPEAA